MDVIQPGRDELIEPRAWVELLRLIGGFVVFIGLVAIAGWAFRTPLESFGRWFVTRLGAFGIAGGSFLADGCHFPLPPQFFLFTGIAGGYSAVAALASTFAGSVVGGFFAFVLARRLGASGFVARRVQRPRRLVERMLARYGYWGLAIAALLPISYWVLCTLAGAMRLPRRSYAVLAAMRVPRLLLSYAVIAVLW